MIEIDGREVKFRATARTPRLYRVIIGRDMIRDMAQLRKNYMKVQQAPEDQREEATLSILDLQIFEDIAYIMAKHADPEMKEKTADEWLDGFEMFSIYEILPQLLELWAMNEKTTSTPKKK